MQRSPPAAHQWSHLQWNSARQGVNCSATKAEEIRTKKKKGLGGAWGNQQCSSVFVGFSLLVVFLWKFVFLLFLLALKDGVAVTRLACWCSLPFFLLHLGLTSLMMFHYSGFDWARVIVLGGLSPFFVILFVFLLSVVLDESAHALLAKNRFVIVGGEGGSLWLFFLVCVLFAHGGATGAVNSVSLHSWPTSLPLCHLMI